MAKRNRKKVRCTF